MGEHCYRVVAVNNIGPSQPSATACATVIAGPAPSTEALTGAYVLYGEPILATDPDAYPKALQAVNTLTGRGLQAKLLDTTRIPIQGVPASYIAYQDGLETTIQAQQYCGLIAQQQIECHATTHSADLRVPNLDKGAFAHFTLRVSMGKLGRDSGSA